MTDLLSLPMQELTRWVTQELGEPKYRAKQLYDWLHKKQVTTLEEIPALLEAADTREIPGALVKAILHVKNHPKH